jgi:crotonobetainyl-CoA:carnitine CoA-transferase CaiB-like acyl-CoA transferase
MLRTGAPAPRYVPATVCDRIVGQATANAVLAALFHRARTGAGQAVDVPMFETMTQFVLGDHFGGRTFDPPLGESGYARVLAKFRAPYATRDGFICALIYNDKQWRSFLTLIGKPALFASDPRFSTHSNRAERIEEVYTFVADEMRTRTTAEWADLLSAGDIPWMPMNTLDELIDDPHLAATGFFVSAEHPSEGTMKTTAVPTRWSASQPQMHRHAPRFGEHSAEILGELGYSQADIERMAAAGVTVLARKT